MIAGILGGGQLGRMLALAAQPLGIDCLFLDPAADACAAAVAQPIRAAFDDPVALRELARRCEVVTWEFENVPPASAELVAGLTRLRPNSGALAAGRDRLDEKSLFERLGIPTARFVVVDTPQDLQRAAAELGFPFLAKTRTLGYDGKGQVRVDAAGDLDRAAAMLAGRPAIAETLVDFRREVSAIAVRGDDGTTHVYPLSENRHRDGILRFAVNRPADPVAATASGYVRDLAAALDYVGVIALELFDTGDRLLANEFAPRVHNSGHWTIEGAATSQFENHMRAVAGLPLGSTAARGHAAMINLIGVAPDAAEVLRCPNAHLHLYGKAPRPGRKIGHVTVTADSTAELDARLAPLAHLLDPTDRRPA